MNIDQKDFVKAKVHVHLTPGEALKMLRIWQGLTQADLAKKTWMSQSNISALESNIKQIGREMAIILAKALKVHHSVLFFPDFYMAKVA